MSVIGASLVPLPSGTLVNPSRSVVTTIRRASRLTLRPSTVYEGDASTDQGGRSCDCLVSERERTPHGLEKVRVLDR